MARRATRQAIVEAADRLFYAQGFEHTSFADIAGVVNISRGNFYHHFKTKDEILDAVINMRLDQTRLMIERWEADGETPADRIRSFIRILIVNQEKIRRFGCPVGTLFFELAKLDHGAQAGSRGLFSLFRTWLRRQFTLLGLEADADDLAMHLLASSQGVAALVNAFPDEDIAAREVDRMCAWLDALIERARGEKAGHRVQ